MHRLNNKYVLAAIAFAICMPMLFLTDIPQRDVAYRYAPMIQAFADFNWALAFHPRIPMLHTTVGGIIALIPGIDPYMAAKLASALFFSLAVIPLFLLMKRVFDEKTAALGCFLYMFSPQLLRYASSGMRDSAKSFAFIMAVFALIVIFQERRAIKGYVWMGCACGLLMLTRGDCVMYAFCFMVCMLVFEVLPRRFPWKSIIAGFVLLFVITPSLLMNLKMTGYPVTEARFAVIMESLCNKVKPVFSDSSQPVKTPSVSVKQAAKISVTDDEDSVPDVSNTNRDVSFRINGELISDFIESIIKGFFPIFAIPALLMIILRIRNRTWKPEETILLSAFLGHVFLIIFQIAVFDRYLYVSRRYLLTVTPLEYGWAALFVIWVYSYVSSIKNIPNDKLLAGIKFLPSFSYSYIASMAKADIFRKLCIFALFCLAVGLYANAVTPLIKDRVSSKHAYRRLAALDFADFIRKDYSGPATDKPVAHVSLFEYISYRRPIVAGMELPVLGYLCGGSGSHAEFADVMRSGAGVDYVASSIDINAEEPVVSGFTPVRRYSSDKKLFILWKKVGGGN